MLHSRRVVLLASIVCVAMLMELGSSAHACRGSTQGRNRALEGLTKEVLAQSPGSKLVGTVYTLGDQHLDDSADSCGRLPWENLATLAHPDRSELTLVGEVHDNPWHHRIRAAMMSIAGSTKRPTAAVFEQIRADQQKGLDEFKAFNAEARRLGTAGDLFRFLDWEHSGWPDKAIFAPLFEAVIAAKMPIYAGDPARGDIKRVAKEGEAGLAEGDAARLGLDKPLPPATQVGLLDDLERSHCGLMPKTAFGNLAYAQRYRDAFLADVVLRAAAENGSAILFAGNGHVRADRGVPYYLRQRAPDKKLVTVMLMEVEEGKDKPEDYDLKGSDGQPIADYVVFTPRAERPDPCEEMKQAFEKRAKK